MSLLNDYVHWLLNLSFESTYWITFVVICCVGITLTGFAFKLWGDDGPILIELIPVVGLLATGIVAALWPLVAIAAPFVVVAGCLFFAGMRTHDKLFDR